MTNVEQSPGTPRCFIVPPAFFEAVIREGSAEHRQAALDTLSVDHTLRAARVHQAALSVRGVRPLPPHGVGTPHRTIYDAMHREDQNARVILRHEWDPPVADVSANEAFDGLGATYKFYWDILRRNSIDDAGLPLLAEVHFGAGYNNAFWDGRRMCFGDGDNKLFIGFTKAIDVIGHELTHGITESTLNLQYFGQSGALNESISDVFGSLVKQYALGQTAATADWLIGSGILGPVVEGIALRSMKAPGTAFTGDDQPDNMADYVVTTKDNGGVHTNSGIPNHAFYLAATALGGNAWDEAGRIWYASLSDPALGPTTQFHAFAESTVRSAERLCGTGSTAAKAVGDAWAQVGVL